MEEAQDYAALHDAAAMVDGNARSRLCLLGGDRVKFLNGQVTNNVKDLRPGQGCYAALVTARGKIESDLHIYILDNEILLEFEPGLAGRVQQRLEKFIIAEDVQVVDVAPHYGLGSIQGPKSGAVINKLLGSVELPAKPHAHIKINHPEWGELYVMNRARTAAGGYDVFVPSGATEPFKAALAETGAPVCSAESLEITRVEAGLPRFGVDMDETNLAPEILGETAISYAKGCYIGQEVIARVRTYGQVARALRGLRLPDNLAALPKPADKLFLGDKEVGQITSAVASPRLKANIALGLVRREANKIGTELELQSGAAKVPVKIVELPFAR